MNVPFDTVKLFYKYLPPDVLKDDSFFCEDQHFLKFTNPSDFNDPLDCLFQINNLNWVSARAEKHFYNAMSCAFPPVDEKNNAITKKQHKKRLNTIIPRSIKRDFKKMVEDQNEKIKKIREKILVSCFSSKRDIMPMWSHYAKNHSGFCLGYQFAESSEHPNHGPIFSDMLHKIIYSDSKDLSLIADLFFDHVVRQTIVSNVQKKEFEEYAKSLACDISMQMVMKTVLTKDVSWSYEHEWRVITDLDKIEKRKNGLFLLPIYNYYVSEFLVGCKAEGSLFDKLKEKFPTARGYKCEKNPEKNGVSYILCHDPVREAVEAVKKDNCSWAGNKLVKSLLHRH